MVGTRASVEQDCANRQQPKLLEPHQQQHEERHLQGHRRELQLAQVETSDGVSLDKEREYRSGGTEHQACPQSVQVDKNVSPAPRRDSCRRSELSETGNASRVDAFATGNLESSCPPGTSGSVLQRLDGDVSRYLFCHTPSGVPHLSSGQDSYLEHSGGSRGAQGLSAYTRCATEQHSDIGLTEQQHNRDLDRSGEINFSCNDVNDGHLRNARRSDQPDGSASDTRKKGRLHACSLLLVSHASRCLPSRNRRSPPMCTLQSLSTRDTLEQQQRALQQVSSNILYQQHSLSSSLELHPENIHLGNPDSRRRQQGQDKSRAQQSLQLIRNKARSPFSRAAAVTRQPSLRPKRDGGAWWRTAGAGSLTETDSLSRNNENASNVAFFQRSICGPQSESNQGDRTGTTAAIDGSYPNYFWEQFRAEEAAAAPAASSCTVGGELGRTGKEEEQLSPVMSGEKRQEIDSNEEALPACAVGQHTTSGTASEQPFFSRLAFRRFSLPRQAATAPQVRRRFARSASAVTKNRERVFFNKSGATRNSSRGLTSGAPSNATRGRVYSHGQNSPAGTNSQLHPRPAVNPNGSISFQERSPESCLFSSSRKADKTVAAEAAGARAANMASESSQNVGTEEQREDEACLQEAKEHVSTAGEKWQGGRPLTNLEKVQSDDEIGREQKEESDAPNEKARYGNRKAAQHKSRHPLFQVQSRKFTLLRFLSSANREMKVEHDAEHCEASYTKRATPTGSGTGCMRVEAEAKRNTVTSEEGRVSANERSGRSLRDRAATLFASLRSSSLHDTSAAVGRGARESGRRSAGARLKDAEGGRRAAGDGVERGAAGAEGKGVGRKRRAQKARAADACRVSQALQNPDYASYLQWHEEKWGEKIFDQIEVADIDIFSHPLRRGLGCAIM